LLEIYDIIKCKFKIKKKLIFFFQDKKNPFQDFFKISQEFLGISKNFFKIFNKTGDEKWII